VINGYPQQRYDTAPPVQPQRPGTLTPRGVRYGAVLACLARTGGLQDISASSSGFITRVFVMLLPLRVAFGPDESLTPVRALSLALPIIDLGEWGAGHNAHVLTAM
jgi:hypothetical protein